LLLSVFRIVATLSGVGRAPPVAELALAAAKLCPDHADPASA